MTKETGGPAFPCSNEQFTAGNSVSGDAAPGMSLRDWFAGQALAGMATGYAKPGYEATTQGLANLAYALADAMLAERSKP